MTKPLHERLAALHEFLSPPSANALSPPGLELLAEAVKALTPPKAGEIAASAIEMPWPSLHAGMRLVTGAYPRSVVADYGNSRAVERDAFWRGEIDRLKHMQGAELIEFLGIDPLSISAGAHHPMIPDSWRFGFVKPDGSLLRFQRMDAGPLVAWEAVARFVEQPAISDKKREPTAWISPRELEALRSNRAAFVTPGGSDTDTPMYGE